MGARREDEVVVVEGSLAGAVGGLDPGRLGVRVDGGGGAEDELEVFFGVLGEAGFDGVEDLVVFDEAGDDGADGSYVPVEVCVLKVNVNPVSTQLQSHQLH